MIRDVLTFKIPTDPQERDDIYRAYAKEYEKGMIALPTSLIERVISADVAEALRDKGIWVFPPVFFNLYPTPKILVVSRRNRIERVPPDPLFQPDLDWERRKEIERFVEELDPNLSAYVADIGGIAVIPPIIDYYSPMILADVAAHEWCHHYLHRFPLGMNWLLGLKRNIASLNELTCNIVGKEIQSAIAVKYGWERVEPKEKGSSAENESTASIREIRRQVDLLLGSGKIEEAEELMRIFTESLKTTPAPRINQAYFSFHGAYGGGEAGDSPLPRQMRELREKAGSLKNFLQKIRRVGSLERFRRLLDEEEIE